eukprot:TRINITY_DN12228_c0_g1_i1.p1 TRINITY_DN12228_c0_g1~~TRINITY_DN12228_c0_g1_i1.p1  ORF type:complete len:165 (-),score=5.70 TRINITY_DN12228_c0_g1_i1:101-595(-)
MSGDAIHDDVSGPSNRAALLKRSIDATSRPDIKIEWDSDETVAGYTEAKPVVTTSSVPGKPVSGRTWKQQSTERSSAMIERPAALRKTWEEKNKDKAQYQAMKSHEKELKDAAKQEAEAKKQKIAEKKRRREENEKKNEKVQKISDTRKIKKMNKKQLRTIKKA